MKSLPRLNIGNGLRIEIDSINSKNGQSLYSIRDSKNKLILAPIPSITKVKKIACILLDRKDI